MGADQLADLHKLAFRHAPAPWSAAAFGDLLSDPSAHLIAGARGFILGRIVVPEAEILTLAVHPRSQRRGIACALVAGFERRARNAGTEAAFLEVARANTAGRALYTASSYRQVGVRPKYYLRSDGTRDDALVMRKCLARNGGHIAEMI